MMPGKRNAEANDAEVMVLTLAVDAAAQAYFDELRRTHFPMHLNLLNAHITLFHALPMRPDVTEHLAVVAGRTSPFAVAAHDVITLGRGTAVAVGAPKLRSLFTGLQRRWSAFLTLQDSQQRSFHVTVQNKVDAVEAKRVRSLIEARFDPFLFEAVGLHLWRYLGGAWEHSRTFRFRPHTE